MSRTCHFWISIFDFNHAKMLIIIFSIIDRMSSIILEFRDSSSAYLENMPWLSCIARSGV